MVNFVQTYKMGNLTNFRVYFLGSKQGKSPVKVFPKIAVLGLGVSAKGRIFQFYVFQGASSLGGMRIISLFGKKLMKTSMEKL